MDAKAGACCAKKKSGRIDSGDKSRIAIAETPDDVTALEGNTRNPIVQSSGIEPDPIAFSAEAPAKCDALTQFDNFERPVRAFLPRRPEVRRAKERRKKTK